MLSADDSYAWRKEQHPWGKMQTHNQQNTAQKIPNCHFMSPTEDSNCCSFQVRLRSTGVDFINNLRTAVLGNQRNNLNQFN